MIPINQHYYLNEIYVSLNDTMPNFNGTLFQRRNWEINANNRIRRVKLEPRSAPKVNLTFLFPSTML